MWFIYCWLSGYASRRRRCAVWDVDVDGGLFEKGAASGLFDPTWKSMSAGPARPASMVLVVWMAASTAAAWLRAARSFQVSHAPLSPAVSHFSSLMFPPCGRIAVRFICFIRRVAGKGSATPNINPRWHDRGIIFSTFTVRPVR